MTINIPNFHPQLGKPSKIYAYRDASGETYAAVYRFDTPDGKTIRPYDRARASWNFPDTPPPYHADYIGNALKNPVIIVEGEKCADTLERFEFLGITSLGGSGQASKTDWTSDRKSVV